jgi:DNA-binding NarL/FixJ family response regulator
MEIKLKVLIADDHPIFRRGLREVIETDAGMFIVGEAEDGLTALKQIEDLSPDVAVLDIDMPGLSGFALAKEIKRKNLAVAIVFLTMHKDESMFNEALEVGVRGYVLKDSAVADIAASIRAVARGEHYLSPLLSTFIVNRNRSAVAFTQENPRLAKLTPTERRVLRLIAENKTSKEIAAELFISYRTVENHRANISHKLNLSGSHALLKFALTHTSQLA